MQVFRGLSLLTILPCRACCLRDIMRWTDEDQTTGLSRNRLIATTSVSAATCAVRKVRKDLKL